MLVRDAIAWRPGQILMSTAEGLYVLEVKTGLLKHLEPVGLDGDVGRLARDRHGRTWVGGTGLWLLEDEGRARAMQGSLPFFGGQEVLSLIPCQNADVLAAVEDRGVALLSPGAKHPTVAVPPDELSRASEPSREQTVIAYVPWIRDSDLGKEQRSEQAFWRLLHDTADDVEASGLGRFGGVEYADCYVLFFHGPDAEILAAKIAPVLAASDAVSSLSLVKRFGPPGARRVVQTIKAEHQPPK
jgi:hypothetical protein